MRKWTKVLAIILGVVILASIAVAGSVALAADPPSTNPPVTTNTTSPWDVFLSKLAAKLNVTVDQLKPAMTQARTDTVNQLAAEGKITASQKDWMLNRMQQGPFGQGGFGPGSGPGFGPGARGFAGGPFNGSTPWGGTPPWSQASPAPTK